MSKEDRNMPQGGGGEAGQAQQGGANLLTGAGVSDAEFDLISLVYHALQAAEVYHVYLEDAEEEGMAELQQLLQEAREQNLVIARRAREILLRQGGGK